MSNFPDQEFSINQPMRSARGDAEALKYRMFMGKSGKRWLVAIQPNEADNIYVEGNRNSDGFGGATLRFELEDGSVVNLKGPWKTGPDGLLKDTGHDATEKCLSRGIIALERESLGPWPKGHLYKNVLHADDDWVLGHFDRIKILARGFANKLGKKVWTGVVSYGGGSAGWEDPAANGEGE